MCSLYHYSAAFSPPSLSSSIPLLASFLLSLTAAEGKRAHFLLSVAPKAQLLSEMQLPGRPLGLLIFGKRREEEPDRPDRSIHALFSRYVGGGGG